MDSTLTTIKESGIAPLGPSNKGSVERFANICSVLTKEGIQPRSRFLELVADRMVGKSKLDASLILSGEKGSGKSYSALSIATNLAKILSEKTGRRPEDHFALEKNSCVLSDSDSINEIIKNAKPQQIILVDDTGIVFSNRSFQEKKNRDFNRILSICRTQRWFMIFTVPVRAQVDLALRQLANFYGVVYKSFHRGGFNLLKIYSVDLREQKRSGPESFTRKISYDDTKIDFYCVWGPDEELALKYDKLRDEATKKLVNAGGKLDKKTVETKEKRMISMINALKKSKNPNLKEMERKYGFSYPTISAKYKKIQAGEL